MFSRHICRIGRSRPNVDDSMKNVVQYSATFDATWDDIDIVFSSSIEQFSAMLCGSLPALRPLVVSVVPRVYSNIRAKTSCGTHSRQPSDTRQSLEPVPVGGEHPMSATSHSSPYTEPSLSTSGMEKLGESEIRVTKTIELKWESGTWYDGGSQHDSEDVGQIPSLPRSPSRMHMKK